jgi:acyl-CoA thioester hydrolase
LKVQSIAHFGIHSMTSSIQPLANYAHQTFDKLRYGDTDRQGHVNNAVFSTLFETGRVEMLYAAGKMLHDLPVRFV